MTADLVLAVLQGARDDRGATSSLAVIDGAIVGTSGPLGGGSWRGVRGLALAGDALWACGDNGYLAVSFDRGATWSERDSGTRATLRAVTASGEAVWIAGDGGFAARAGEPPIDLGTTANLTAVCAVADAIVVLASDGAVRKWPRREIERSGSAGPRSTAARTGVSIVQTGAHKGLAGLAVTKRSWLVVGGGGFIARSPDGAWFSRVKTDTTADLTAVAVLADGRVIAVGDRVVLESADDGRTWRQIAEAPAKLWSVVPFGPGALVGGDGGMILRLAASTDETMPVQLDPKQALDVAPRAKWVDLAWKWLGDGDAHRELVERLAKEPDIAAQLAALAGLRSAPDRDVAVARIASELAPELEAVLAGAVARGEDLEIEREDDTAAGWDAIDRALEAVYHGAEPDAHFGTVLPYMLGGNDPLHGISAYARPEPPHWHFVTYGFTDLFGKETDDPDESGFGFELTFRLARDPADTKPPMWALNFLQNLARYVFNSGNRFAAGHKMGLNGPIALDTETAITAVCFADDPEFGDISSPYGAARFVQVVGITDDEYKLIQEWSTTRLVDMLRRGSSLLVTCLARPSLLRDPATAAEVKRLVDAEGSSEDLAFAGDMTLAHDGGTLRVKLGALYAAALPRAMRGRLRHGRSYELRGREASLVLSPGEASAITSTGEASVELALAPGLVEEVERQLRAGLAGVYGFDAWPKLTIEVTPSFIRDQDNRAIEVRGVADPERAQAMLAAENGDEDGDDDEDEEEDDDEPADAGRVKAALAMTERALRLAPDDDDTQFTHAMLLLDADKAGIAGKIDVLLALLPTFEAGVRVNVATRMGKAKHARFADAVDVALGEALPERIVAERSAGSFASFGDVADELFAELGEGILAYAPDRMPRLIALLPDDVELLSQLAFKATEAKQSASALALYDRLLALPVPGDGDARLAYLRALNNACIHAHAVKAFDTAVRIADRAQPVAHENPYIYHSAACAYAAAGDLDKAFRQVELAVEHDYEHLARLEVDSDLGELLTWPRFKALFRDWHARSEGN